MAKAILLSKMQYLALFLIVHAAISAWILRKTNFFKSTTSLPVFKEQECTPIANQPVLEAQCDPGALALEPSSGQTLRFLRDRAL